MESPKTAVNIQGNVQDKEVVSKWYFHHTAYREAFCGQPRRKRTRAIVIDPPISRQFDKDIVPPPDQNLLLGDEDQIEYFGIPELRLDQEDMDALNTDGVVAIKRVAPVSFIIKK
ncbi:hypothetical protein RvY_11148 [Ramazzottius varieornatus]|uniref:Uncharacterized protein n=1 Tax=Ramazzottius varieornatus TaxID=947166 RepID=A0A1D1VMY5_RAMVA|nr:hypothetical protein RvY_11148 [Ramazzottius varieornatus]